MLSVEERIITTAVGKVRKQLREERQREAARRQGQPATSNTTPTPVDGPSITTQTAVPPQTENTEPALTAEEEAVLAGIIPDSKPVTPSAIDLQTKRQKDNELFLQTEQLLIQMIIRHGEKVMCNIKDQDGAERPITVVEYINLSLMDDELQLQSPLHQRILDEALEHYWEEGFRCDRYFENHPDLTIAELATELAHEKETLSKIHNKGIPIKPEEERLSELIPHLMGDYKLAVIDRELRKLLDLISSPEVMANKERSIELMKRYQEIKHVQSQLGRMRGDRVLM